MTRQLAATNLSTFHISRTDDRYLMNSLIGINFNARCCRTKKSTRYNNIFRQVHYCLMQHKHYYVPLMLIENSQLFLSVDAHCFLSRGCFVYIFSVRCLGGYKLTYASKLFTLDLRQPSYLKITAYPS